jgi:hypothetical protein
MENDNDKKEPIGVIRAIEVTIDSLEVRLNAAAEIEHELRRL